jgi:hypothetical protein
MKNIFRIIRAWWQPPASFDSAVPAKGGHNDLSRWKHSGGDLPRPDPPAPIAPKARR